MPGKTWGNAIRLDDEASLGRVDIEMLDDGTAIASWMEFANGRSQFKVRRVSASGQRSAASRRSGRRAGPAVIRGWRGRAMS